MIKEICKDEEFLAIPSEPATIEDADVLQDLLDTFESMRSECIGLAANMIGVSKAIIVFDDNGKTAYMLNPRIRWANTPYKIEEGCMSLEGDRTAKRFQRVKIAYEVIEDGELVKKERSYRDITAEVIQHEIDHCKGIII